LTKIDEAKEILKALGLPKDQQNEISGYTLLALCRLAKKGRWEDTTQQSMGVSKGIMDWLRTTYNLKYAPNSRETFRRHVLHQFIHARLIDINPDNPKLPTNSALTHYKLTDDALRVIKTFGSDNWDGTVEDWIKNVGTLKEKYMKARELQRIPLELPNGKIVNLSPGKHNEVQAAVIEHFAALYAHDTELVYLGDTAQKNLFINEKLVKKLGIKLDHNKLPDVILYNSKRKWLYLIEAVTSHGPMTPTRVMELTEMFRGCNCGLIFVSAFPDRSEFRNFMKEIAWETEVWLADDPEHLIHFNGGKFMGPH
jgi:type II restriction enzyme